MRDNRLREILLDRRSISEIPGEVYDFIARIVEDACRRIKGDCERINAYGPWSDDDFSYDISPIHFDRDIYFRLCAARRIFHDKRSDMITAIGDSEFEAIRICRKHLLAVQ